MVEGLLLAMGVGEREPEHAGASSTWKTLISLVNPANIRNICESHPKITRVVVRTPILQRCGPAVPHSTDDLRALLGALPPLQPQTPASG